MNPVHTPSLLRSVVVGFKGRAWTGGVLRTVGQERDEVVGGPKKPNDEELHNLCSSPSIIRMIESRRMRWAGHVARMGEKRNA
jgi:hypothetical protein